MVQVGAPDLIPMSLCQAAGISSDAPASRVQLVRPVEEVVNPFVDYWPVTSTRFPSAQSAMRFDAGDGGSLENAGLLALLQRGANKVIWVASSYRGLNSDYDLDAATEDTFDPDQAGVTEQLYDKFGYGYETADLFYSHNQVFAKDSLLPIVREIAALKNDGKPAVVNLSLEVLENAWVGHPRR